MMSSVNKNTFIFSFHISMSFMSISCLLLWLRPLRNMLNRRGENVYPCLFLILEGKDSPGAMLSVSFS